ncbi:MAG: rod-binding protein [Sphingobium sp.]|jgi:flagellar protein FlgJ|nr:rod-binding protein [Sphingobium sp.]MCI1270143.1 rod-binding protein [Sphingobium sp.]MCI1754930.1 rod-binding protein [Sphingobium sp.]MCI2051675.1 rod-binding protein [Sphingobium sp.]
MDIGTTTGIALNAGKAAPAKAPRDPGLEKAAKAFEAVFLRQMIGAMRASSMGEGIFDSSATEQFRDMADAKTAENMAQTGKFGVAELLIQQFGARATAAQSLTAKPEIANGSAQAPLAITRSEAP